MDNSIPLQNRNLQHTDTPVYSVFDVVKYLPQNRFAHVDSSESGATSCCDIAEVN